MRAVRRTGPGAVDPETTREQPDHGAVRRPRLAGRAGPASHPPSVIAAPSRASRPRVSPREPRRHSWCSTSIAPDAPAESVSAESTVARPGGRVGHDRQPAEPPRSDRAALELHADAPRSSPSAAKAGDVVTYTATVVNAGPNASAGTATFTLPVPSALRFAALVPAAGWSCVAPAVGTTGTVTCTRSGHRGRHPAGLRRPSHGGAGHAACPRWWPRPRCRTRSWTPTPADNAASAALQRHRSCAGRHRWRHAARRLGDAIRTRSRQRDRRQRHQRRPRWRRPHQHPGTERQHAPARLLHALLRRGRREHVLHDALRAAQRRHGHGQRAVALPARHRRPARPAAHDRCQHARDRAAHRHHRHGRRRVRDGDRIGPAVDCRPHHDLGRHRLRQSRRVQRRPRPPPVGSSPRAPPTRASSCSTCCRTPTARRPPCRSSTCCPAAPRSSRPTRSRPTRAPTSGSTPKPGSPAPTSRPRSPATCRSSSSARCT